MNVKVIGTVLLIVVLFMIVVGVGHLALSGSPFPF